MNKYLLYFLGIFENKPIFLDEYKKKWKQFIKEYNLPRNNISLILDNLAINSKEDDLSPEIDLVQKGILTSLRRELFFLQAAIEESFESVPLTVDYFSDDKGYSMFQGKKNLLVILADSGLRLQNVLQDTTSLDGSWGFVCFRTMEQNLPDGYENRGGNQDGNEKIPDWYVINLIHHISWSHIIDIVKALWHSRSENGSIVLSDQGIELDKVFEILNSGREYAMIRPYKGGHSLAIDSAHLELLEPKTSFRDPVIQILDYQAQLRNGNSILWYTGVNQEDNLSFGTSSSEELALDLELFLKINHFPVPEENSFVEALIKRFYSGEKKIMIITERIPSSLSLLDNEGISLYVQCQEKVSSIAVQALYGGKSLTGEKEAINELSSQKWDVIFFLHEPETLLSRKELTEKIARALVPGGKLLFSLKNPRAINSLDSYLSDYSPKPILFYTSDWKGLLEPLDLEVIYEPVMFGYNENEIVYNELKDALEKAFPHAGAKISGTIRETARLMCAVKKGGDRK